MSKVCRLTVSLFVSMQTILWGVSGTSAVFAAPNAGPQEPMAPPPASSPPAPHALLNYVGLGDSRAADPQITTLGISPCARSEYSYPNLVGNLLHLSSVNNVSCIAATTKDFFYPQNIGVLPVSPQLNSLNANTDIVTVSIGGNDINWYGLIGSCFTKVPGVDAHCRDNLGLQLLINRKLSYLKSRLDMAFDGIHAKSPFAKVFVVGHGGYYGALGCPVYVQSSPQDLAWIAQFFHAMNLVMAQEAQDHGDSFVDIETPARGHDACQPTGRWFTGNVSQDGTPRRHPTALGAREMALIVSEAIKRVIATGQPVMPGFVAQPNPATLAPDLPPQPGEAPEPPAGSSSDGESLPEKTPAPPVKAAPPAPPAPATPPVK